MSKPATVAACAIETPDGRLIALIALPHELGAFSAILDAFAEAHPDAMCSQGRRYTVTPEPEEGTE